MNTSETPILVSASSLKPGINKLKGHVYIQAESGEPALRNGMTLIAEGNITVGGDIESGTRDDDEHVIVESLKGEVTVNGIIGHATCIKAKKNIEAEEVLPGAEMKSEHGNIIIDRRIGNTCRAFAHHGKIICPDIGDNVIIEQMSEDGMTATGGYSSGAVHKYSE